MNEEGKVLSELIRDFGEIAVRDVLTAMVQISGLSPYPLIRQKIVKPRETALLFLPGGPGHEYREREVIRLWRATRIAKYFLFAGRNEEPPYTREYVVSLLGREYEKNIFFAPKARHTPDQTSWAIEQLRTAPKLSRVTHIIVATAAYHVPRGFLTLLRSFEKIKEDGKDFNRGVMYLSSLPVINPDDPATDYVGFAWTGSEGLIGEAKRILTYQQAKYNQVASVESFLSYLRM